MDQFRSAVTLPEAWSVESGGGRGVIFTAQTPPDGELVVTPDGTLGLSQRVAPLGITIDRSDPWQIEGGYNWFDLEAGEPGMQSTGSLYDWFTVSSYIDLSPRELLSAPSFDLLPSGIAFAGGEATSGTARKGTLDYEQILRDPNLDDTTVQLPPFHLADDPRPAVWSEMATGSGAQGFSIASSELSIQVASPSFVVMDRETGAVLHRKRNWTASRASNAGRKQNVVIMPDWEIP